MDQNWDKGKVLFFGLIIVESDGYVRAIRRILDLQSLTVRYSDANNAENIFPSLLQQLLFGIQMFLQSDFTRQTPTIV